MYNKNAQIQMLETISVLFIFFVLVLIGLVFYSSIIRSNIEIQKEESVQLKAIEVAQRSSSLPELQCSEDNIISDNCIDIIKLEAAIEVMRENEIHYYDRLLFSRITVTRIYPENIVGKSEWTLYDRSLEDFSNKILTNIPISLFDPVENKNTFGVMTVELFLKS